MTTPLIVCSINEKATLKCLGSVSAMPGIPGFWYGVSTPLIPIRYINIDMGMYFISGVRHPIPWAIEQKMWYKFISYAINEGRIRRLLIPIVKGLTNRAYSAINKALIG